MESSLPRKIITLKWGTRYGASYVNRLASAVRRNLAGDVEIVCFTDDPEGIDSAVSVHPIPLIDLPPGPMITGWRKLCLFRDDLPVDGLGLFLDLDIVITGSLDLFFDFETPDKIPIIHNWVSWHKTLFRPAPVIGNSSVFRFHLNHCRFVWDQFHRERDWALANFSPPQSYLTHCIMERMEYWPPEWVCSFKRHCRPRFPLNLVLQPALPERARIVAFHGKPDPDEAEKGYRDGKLHHRTKAAPWISKHWR